MQKSARSTENPNAGTKRGRRAALEYIAGLTTRGRVTIPKAIRDQAGLQPADKIHFALEDGVVKLEKVSPPVGDTTGNAPDVAAAIPDIRRLEL